jgi:hypothetical protein
MSGDLKILELGLLIGGGL